MVVLRFLALIAVIYEYGISYCNADQNIERVDGQESDAKDSKISHGKIIYKHVQSRNNLSENKTGPVFEVKEKIADKNFVEPASNKYEEKLNNLEKSMQKLEAIVVGQSQANDTEKNFLNEKKEEEYVRDPNFKILNEMKENVLKLFMDNSIEKLSDVNFDKLYSSVEANKEIIRLTREFFNGKDLESVKECNNALDKLLDAIPKAKQAIEIPRTILKIMLNIVEKDGLLEEIEMLRHNELIGKEVFEKLCKNMIKRFENSKEKIIAGDFLQKMIEDFSRQIKFDEATPANIMFFFSDYLLENFVKLDEIFKKDRGDFAIKAEYTDRFCKTDKVILEIDAQKQFPEFTDKDKEKIDSLKGAISRSRANSVEKGKLCLDLLSETLHKISGIIKNIQDAKKSPKDETILKQIKLNHMEKNISGN